MFVREWHPDRNNRCIHNGNGSWSKDFYPSVFYFTLIWEHFCIFIILYNLLRDHWRAVFVCICVLLMENFIKLRRKIRNPGKCEGESTLWLHLMPFPFRVLISNLYFSSYVRGLYICWGYTGKYYQLLMCVIAIYGFIIFLDTFSPVIL